MRHLIIKFLEMSSGFFFFFTSIQVSELDTVVIKRKRTENSLIIVNISKKTLTLKQTALLCLHRQQEQKQRLCEGYKGGGYNCGYQLFSALYCSTFSSDNKCYLFQASYSELLIKSKRQEPGEAFVFNTLLTLCSKAWCSALLLMIEALAFNCVRQLKSSILLLLGLSPLIQQALVRNILKKLNKVINALCAKST